MPELPEVETMVRGIRAAVEGQILTAVRACPCDCRPLTLHPTLPVMQRRTRGQAVVKVRRQAKRVLLELSGGDAFVIEPRMTGLMLLADPPDIAHLRIEWRLTGANGTATSLWFWDRRGLGTVRLLSAAEREVALGPTRLGPDALELQAADWKTICGRTSRAIKVALLDQKLVAGIGNLYASEILHAARIHPTRPACELTPAEIRRLASATKRVLQTAIRYEGSTLGDGTYRNALNQNGGYQNKHRVYARVDQLCPTCRIAPVQRIVQAQRSTFYCPTCQT